MSEFFEGVIVEEILSLVLTLLLTVLFWIPYAIKRIMEMGLTNAFLDTDTPVSAAWAQRLKSAHENAVDGLVIFAPAVIMLHVLHLNSFLTSIACMVYFVTKLAYFVMLPPLRGILFFIEAGAQVVLLLSILVALVW